MCESLGRFLVIPTSRSETQAIRDLLPAGNVRAWLGIRKINSAWVADDPNFGPITWSDWKSAGEGNTGEPNAGMVWQSGWNGQWYDMVPRGRKHYAVCALPAPPSPQKLVLLPQQLTHPKAASMCESLGRFLVIPTSRSETQAIRDLLPAGNVRAWLGIRKINSA